VEDGRGRHGKDGYPAVKAKPTRACRTVLVGDTSYLRTWQGALQAPTGEPVATTVCGEGQLAQAAALGE
jgi:hypothetical protein